MGHNLIYLSRFVKWKYEKQIDCFIPQRDSTCQRLSNYWPVEAGVQPQTAVLISAIWFPYTDPTMVEYYTFN